MEDAGGEPIRPLRAPHEPTEAEIEEHNATHAHYRAWCPHCVAGKGKADSHRQLEAERDHAIPTISCDYMYMGTEKGREDTDELSRHCMPILVSKDHRKRYVDSFVVPKKGVQHRYPIEALANVLKHSGYNEFSKVTRSHRL